MYKVYFEKKLYFCTMKHVTTSLPAMIGDTCQKADFFDDFSTKETQGESVFNYSLFYDCNDEVPFSFTGKERDEETGYGYFGARYYNADLLTGWMSVDPMADKYPSISPYNYCAWNPVKLVDSDGRKIKNAFLQYKDISNDIAYYQQRMISDPESKKQYEYEIKELETKHNKYLKIQEAIDAFRNANIEEYDIIDNLTFDGRAVDVIVGVDLTNATSPNGATGETIIKYKTTEDGKVVGINNQFGNNSISVVLYRNAFLGDSHGLGTIANEFGDVLFSVLRPDYAKEQGLKHKLNEHTYEEDPSARFSFAYEYYICNPKRNKKPNPYEY